jgi:hypothetical protein
VVYTGIALGKKVHSLFDVNELKRLAPIQNNGVSAKNIAAICRGYLKHNGNKESFDPQQAMNKYQVDKPGVQLTEELIANW